MKMYYENKRNVRRGYRYSRMNESEDRLMTRYYNRDGLKPWRGCRSIKFKSNGTQSDPDLIYKNYVFNYWDIEDALWDLFLEYNDLTEKDVYDGNNIRPDIEKQFDQFVCDAAPSYLDDYIANGAPKNWHSKHEGYGRHNKKRISEDFHDGYRYVTKCSFDFAHNGNYNEKLFQRRISDLLNEFGADWSEYIDFEDMTSAYKK